MVGNKHFAKGFGLSSLRYNALHGYTLYVSGREWSFCVQVNWSPHPDFPKVYSHIDCSSAYITSHSRHQALLHALSLGGSLETTKAQELSAHVSHPLENLSSNSHDEVSAQNQAHAGHIPHDVISLWMLLMWLTHTKPNNLLWVFISSDATSKTATHWSWPKHSWPYHKTVQTGLLSLHFRSLRYKTKSEQWTQRWITRTMHLKRIKRSCLCHVRRARQHTIITLGWSIAKLSQKMHNS